MQVVKTPSVGQVRSRLRGADARVASLAYTHGRRRFAAVTSRRPRSGLRRRTATKREDRVVGGVGQARNERLARIAQRAREGRGLGQEAHATVLGGRSMVTRRPRAQLPQLWVLPLSLYSISVYSLDQPPSAGLSSRRRCGCSRFLSTKPSVHGHGVEFTLACFQPPPRDMHCHW